MPGAFSAFVDSLYGDDDKKADVTPIRKTVAKKAAAKKATASKAATPRKTPARKAAG